MGRVLLRQPREGARRRPRRTERVGRPRDGTPGSSSVDLLSADYLVQQQSREPMTLLPIRPTFEFTRSLQRAKPAVASRVQRRVRPHGCSEALGRVACPKFMAMKKVDAERTSSFAS